MNHFFPVYVLIASLLTVSFPAHADSIVLGQDASIESILADHTGQRVSLMMESGNELTGNVITVNDEVVHLGELAGREYFDAAIDMDDISAVIVRTKQ
ncbi:MAG: hypothetical protein U5P41_03230 [Gammaproteobacteria bacterium]|nr:hypothetical protein [Gammaproteobacteria bacterium]